MTSNFGIDMPEHRICAKGAHASTVDRFSIRFESGFHHGLCGITVCHADTLAQAVIERVVQIKDHAADERARLNLFFAFWSDHEKSGNRTFKANWPVFLTRQTRSP